MSYPSHADYDLAVRYLDKFVKDPTLRLGLPRSRNGTAVARGGAPLSFPGGFAKVYVIDCGGRTYALRVWLNEIADAAQRYAATAQFLKQHPLPFFVENFDFIDEGILVNSTHFPILRMEWVEGYSLRDFINLNLTKPDILRTAAKEFAGMVAEMHRVGVAHGDLQSENLLVRFQKGRAHFKLIDYDTLVVPALLGKPIASTGLDSYQHPCRPDSKWTSEKDDYFSELVIYVCLCALAENPHLWSEFPGKGRDKELIFEADDFSPAHPSELFRRLYKMGGAVGRLAVILWNFAKCPEIRLLLPLEAVIELVENELESTPAPVAPRGAFASLMKQKLIGNEAHSPSAPASWTDDCAFLIASSPPKRSVPPPIPARKDSQPEAGQTSSAANTTPSPKLAAQSPTAGGGVSFQDTLRRLHRGQKAKPVPSSKLDGWVVVSLICGIILAAFFIAKWEPDEAEARPKPEISGSSTGREPAPAGATAAGLPGPSTIYVQPDPLESDSRPQARDERGILARLQDEVTKALPGQMPEARRRLALRYSELGWNAANLKRYVLARDNFSKAASADPGWDEGWYGLGLMEEELGEVSSAVRSLENVKSGARRESALARLIAIHAGNGDAAAAAPCMAGLRTSNRGKSREVTAKLSEPFVRQIAVTLYPGIGVSNSAVNARYVNRYFEYKKSNPRFFSHADWPLTLAEEVSK